MTNDYQKARLNISLPPLVRMQAEQTAREQGISTTAWIVRTLESAAAREMQGRGKPTTFPTEEAYAEA